MIAESGRQFQFPRLCSMGMPRAVRSKVTLRRRRRNTVTLAAMPPPIRPIRFFGLRLVLVAIGSTAAIAQPYSYLSSGPAQNFIQAMPVGGTTAVNIPLAGSPNYGTPLWVNPAGTIVYSGYGSLDPIFPPVGGGIVVTSPASRTTVANLPPFTAGARYVGRSPVRDYS